MTRRTKRQLPRTAEKDAKIQRLEQAIVERTEDINRMWLDRVAENTASEIEETAS